MFPNGAETEVLVVGNIEYLIMPPERMGKKGKKRIPSLGRIEYISRFIAQLTPFREKGFEWKVERPLTFRSILFSTVRNLSILRRLSRGQTQQVTKS